MLERGLVLYLCYWMRQSGLADLLPSLRETVWVGLSAGSMVMTPVSGGTSSGGSRPPVAMKRWASLILRCFRTWITRCCRKTPWPTQRSGWLACRYRRTRLTTRPPYRWSTALSKSSPRGTGNCLRRSGKACSSRTPNKRIHAQKGTSQCQRSAPRR
jgi:hypothetical protein